MKTKKGNKLLLKIGVVCTAFLAFLTCLVTPTFAYIENADGNLVSSNLFDYTRINDSYRYSSHAVAFNINAQTGTINFDVQAPQENDPYAYFHDIVTLPAGTYSWSFNSNVAVEQIGFVPNNTTQFDISKILNASSGSNTFTLNSSTTLGFGFEFLQETTTNITIMLNSGSTALPYEMFGEIWYSQNYININSSILNISNFKQATLYYWNEDSAQYHYTFVKNGIFGVAEDTSWNLNLSSFYTDTTLQTKYKEKIYSPYGCFYNTPWSIYEFIWEESSYPYIKVDSVSYLEYEFVTPVDIYNAYFTNVNFDNIQFYNSNGAILQTSDNSPFSINLSGVSKIRCYSSNSDYGDEPYYLVTNTPSSNYNAGYQEGYNSRNEEIEQLNDDLESKERVIDFLNEENNVLTNQLNNVNGSWQSVFFSMVDIPFLTVSKTLGFELFGLNLYRAFIGILTVLAIFFVFRKISGK